MHDDVIKWIHFPHYWPFVRGIHRLNNRTSPLHWRHNDHGGVSNHRPRGGCLLNRLFRRRWKKTSKLRVTGLCVGNSPHKRPVTRKMFPFDDVIMPKSCSLRVQFHLSNSKITQNWYRVLPLTTCLTTMLCGVINRKSALVCILVWSQTGHKLFFKSSNRRVRRTCKNIDNLSCSFWFRCTFLLYCKEDPNYP